MSPLRTLMSLSLAALVTACASPGRAPADEHAAHHPGAAASAPATAVDSRMKTMQVMHEKMANAKTAEERQALMADHKKAMHDGMGMMKSMQGKGGMPGPKDMPADMSSRQHQMEQRMDMMQAMMEMMMDRMPAASPTK